MTVGNPSLVRAAWPALPATRRAGAMPRRATQLARAWFAVLLASICLEGLGRKYIPALPGTFFYFLKDAVLVLGAWSFGVAPQVKHTIKRLIGKGRGLVLLAVGWTLLECLNPDQTHLGLTALGLRSYWLWWMAPLVVASALKDEASLTRASAQLAWVTLVVAGFAAYQFALPAGHEANAYATYEGAEVTAVATVATTGRARVAATFSYVSGFSVFSQTAPFMLLSLGLALGRGFQRTLVMAATAACLATAPMAGSRGSLVLVLLGVALVVWQAGFLSSKQGRRLLMPGLVAVALAAVFSQDALQGVLDRLKTNPEETRDRFVEPLQVFPPVAMASNDYPLLGTGTGSEQNAAYALKLHRSPYLAEGEAVKILVELGPIGSVFLFLARMVLVVALVRGARLLKANHLGAVAGAAYAMAFTVLMGKVHFDHVAQALSMAFMGLLLARVHLCMPPVAPAPQRGAPPSPPRGTGWAKPLGRA